MEHLELAGVRRSALVALGIAVLIPIAVAVWAITQLGGSNPKSPAASAQTSVKTSAGRRLAVAHHATATSYRQSSLFKALEAANESSFAKGLLPLSSCEAMSATMVTCRQPHYAIDEVTFSTYPSMKALYAAYEARVATVGQAPFKANVGNCTETDVNGEIGWNHDFRHPSYYPISMFTSGTIKDTQAAGRMFCTFSNDLLYIVWTQDDGRLLAELAGAPHLDAYNWWHNFHHVIAFPGLPNMMVGMPAMGSTTSTTSTQPSQTVPASHAATPKSSGTMPKSHGMPTAKSGKSMSAMK